jgi:hypothetical protein
VHFTGPRGNFSIDGAMSFENLVMLNGVQIQDNVRGSPFNLFIEDAIQETTITTSGVSAEYGRFAGGVVNAITKSGTNTFNGSYRVTFTNDDWRTISPFGEPKTDDLVPTHEYTFGGPIIQDLTWFFFAGRNFDLSAAAETGFTGVDFIQQVDEKRFEIKLTQKIAQGHTIDGSFTTIRREEVNNAFPDATSVMDLRSLTTRQLPQELFSAHYSGILSSNFFVEAQYSQRGFKFQNDGGLTRDLIEGTLFQDQQTGARWWSPTFCGVCPPEERDNRNFLVKANYFLSTGMGSHQFTMGYDLFNDIRKGDNHQSGSDYHVWTTTSFIENGEVFPIAAADFSTWIIHWPISEPSRGTAFKTHSFFVNDSWQPSKNLTLNLGLRLDKNDGKDAVGNKVVDDAAISPRLGASWDPTGTGDWTVNASYGRYVAAIANTVADSASPAGTPSIFAWFYLGPEINTVPGQPLVSSPEALRIIFDWFNANGAETMEPFFVDVPGVATQIQGQLRSPHSDEFSVGVSKRLGNRGSVRADFVFRKYGDFYSERVDATTGTVTNSIGQTFDINVVENTNQLKRQYEGLNVQANLILRPNLRLGSSYTLSRLHGNVNGENIGSGPLTGDIESYPEFFDPAFSFPEGDLLADQRHRLRLWVLYDIMRHEKYGNVDFAFFEQAESGTPFGAVGSVRTGPFVTGAPDYITPPDTVNYFFAPRDAFRTEAMYRSDIALNYSHRLPGTRRGELFATFHLLNVFNQFQLFNNTNASINTTVLTAVDDPATFQTFNPFTETPVEGVHWAKGPLFGQPIGADAFTLPRTFRFSVGIRF